MNCFARAAAPAKPEAPRLPNLAVGSVPSSPGVAGAQVSTIMGFNKKDVTEASSLPDSSIYLDLADGRTPNCINTIWKRF